MQHSFAQDRRRSVVSGVPFTLLHNFAGFRAENVAVGFFQIEIRAIQSWTHTHALPVTRWGWWLDANSVECTNIYSLRHWTLSLSLCECIWASCVYCYSVCLRHSTMWWGSVVRTANICTNHTDAKLTSQENDGHDDTHEKWINCIFKYFPFDGGPRSACAIIAASVDKCFCFCTTFRNIWRSASDIGALSNESVNSASRHYTRMRIAFRFHSRNL